MYENAKPILLICLECESEFTIKVAYSEQEICHCPFCGEDIKVPDYD